LGYIKQVVINNDDDEEEDDDHHETHVKLSLHIDDIETAD